MFLKSVRYNKFFSVLIFYILISANALYSQLVIGDQPYFCGFEDGEDLSGWVFDNGNNTNQWIIGDSISSDGEKSLYISHDGINAGHDGSAGYVAVYKEFILTNRVTYRISFDWLNPNFDGGLYVCWVPDDYVPGNNSWSGTNAWSLPQYAEYYYKTWSESDKDSVMQGSSRWEHAAFEITGNGRARKLLFYG